MDYIGQLKAGQAGKLILDEGETKAAVRRRLGAAAELLGKSLVVNRLSNVVYFWEEGSGSPRRRGRRRKTDASGGLERGQHDRATIDHVNQEGDRYRCRALFGLAEEFATSFVP